MNQQRSRRFRAAQDTEEKVKCHILPVLHVLPCVLANTYRFVMKDLSQHHLQVNFEAIMTSVVSAANQP